MIYVAAWHVKSESGDDYMGLVVMAEKDLDTVFEDIIKNCYEVEGMLQQEGFTVDEAKSKMSLEEILDECLLYPDVIWTEVDIKEWEEN